MLPKEDREIIAKIGRYKYNKMKEAGFNNFDDYARFRQETKLQNKKKYTEKNRIRFRTIRYVQRYCDLEMKCQICEKEAEIHHPNYNDYLKINLLCKKHHTQLHNFELVPPEIIDLEKIAIKNPPQKAKQQYIQSQIEAIKTDILTNNFNYKKIKEKYGIDPQTLKRYLLKQPDYEKLDIKLKENGKIHQMIRSNSNLENPLLIYKQKYKLTSQKIAKITGIPLPTIRAIECGKTKIENVRNITKQKLLKLTTTDIKERR